MIRQSTIELLREMRFSGMAAELERQLADARKHIEKCRLKTVLPCL